MTLILLNPHSLPSCIAALPTPLLAPFCINHSSPRKPHLAESSSMRYAVHGLTETVPTCNGVRPSLLSIFRSLLSSMSICVRHVPWEVCFMMTQSPLLKLLTPEPVLITSATPSFPATAEGSDVPSDVFKSGLEG